MTIRIDEYSFDKTAEAVLLLNPAAAEEFKTVGNLKFFMVTNTYIYMTKGQFFGTYGFYLTAFNASNGDTEVKATVSPSLVMDYFTKEKMQ